MNTRLLIGAVAGIVIVLIIVILVGNRENQSSPTRSQTSTQNQQIETVTVMVEDSGFSPSTITIKTGTRINWTNNSGGEISINSNEHPTHRLYPELNLGPVPDGSNTSLVFDKPGTYTYHDHYNPSRTGRIIVE